MKTLYFFQMSPDELNIGFHFPYNIQYLDDINFLTMILLQIDCLITKGCGIEFMARIYEELLKPLNQEETKC